MCGDMNTNGGKQRGDILCGRLLVGRDGEPVGRVRGLMTGPDAGAAAPAPQTGFVVVEAASGWLDGKQFLLPVETLTAPDDGPARCPFSRKQFEYGPAWRGGEGFVGLDRHHAYWTGLLPAAAPNTNQRHDNETKRHDQER